MSRIFTHVLWGSLGVAMLISVSGCAAPETITEKENYRKVELTNQKTGLVQRVYSIRMVRVDEPEKEVTGRIFQTVTMAMQVPMEESYDLVTYKKQPLYYATGFCETFFSPDLEFIDEDEGGWPVEILLRAMGAPIGLVAMPFISLGELANGPNDYRNVELSRKSYRQKTAAQIQKPYTFEKPAADIPVILKGAEQNARSTSDSDGNFSFALDSVGPSRKHLKLSTDAKSITEDQASIIEGYATVSIPCE